MEKHTGLFRFVFSEGVLPLEGGGHGKMRSMVRSMRSMRMRQMRMRMRMQDAGWTDGQWEGVPWAVTAVTAVTLDLWL
jgi:hypothetical protein